MKETLLKHTYSLLNAVIGLGMEQNGGTVMLAWLFEWSAELLVKQALDFAKGAATCDAWPSLRS